MGKRRGSTGSLPTRKRSKASDKNDRETPRERAASSEGKSYSSNVGERRETSTSGVQVEVGVEAACGERSVQKPTSARILAKKAPISQIECGPITSGARAGSAAPTKARGRGSRRGTRGRTAVSTRTTTRRATRSNTARGKSTTSSQSRRAACSRGRGGRGRERNSRETEEEQDTDGGSGSSSEGEETEDSNETSGERERSAQSQKEQSLMEILVENMSELQNTMKNMQGKIEALERGRNPQLTPSNPPDSVPTAAAVRLSEMEEGTERIGMSGEILQFPTVEIAHREVSFTAGLKIGDQLPQCIKQKIQDNKFVEFASILNPDYDHQYNVTFSKIESRPHLQLTPNSTKYITAENWTRAFDIFMAVYVQKYPEQLQDLLTYGYTIKSMMQNGQDWNNYDRQFRIAREHSNCSWSSVRVDLLITDMNKYKQSQRRDFRGDFREQIPAGWCYKFHSKSKFCQNRDCNFSHKCPKCDKFHPLYNCMFKSQKFKEGQRNRIEKQRTNATDTSQNASTGGVVGRI